MSTLAPFASYMKLGQGFNSYTQEVCIEDAVLISPRVTPSPTLSQLNALKSASGNLPNGITNGDGSRDVTAAVAKLSHTSEAAAPSSVPEKVPPPGKNMSQIVTYSSRSVSNMADIVDALNISASSSIKHGTVKGSGSASFVNESKVNQSDITYVITVNVTNSMTTYPDEMVFNPLEGLDPKDFTSVFGDCFISGFLEGGEFSAIVSIKVDDKSKIHEVKAAAEADLAFAAVPDTNISASTGLDVGKSSVWKDTETTISVNWSGGGDLKDPGDKWDLPTVVDVACRFPHLVESSAQKTAAILTKYTSLRSFVTENAKLTAKGGKEAGFHIKDYSLCQLYSMDLFSAYMIYKQIWMTLTDMMKHMDRYRQREKSKYVHDPLPLTPKSLSEARELARRQMTIITRENARLAVEPERAEVEVHGDPKALPYIHPNELLWRLPLKETTISIREQVIDSKDSALLTAEEIKIVGDLAKRLDFFLHPLTGDTQPTHKRHLKSENSLFCTIDTRQGVNTSDMLLKLRVHAHQHHHGDVFADLIDHSKAAEGFLSGIGYSTDKDSNTKTRPDGTHQQVGRPNNNPQYWSELADLTFTDIASVVVEYLPGSQKISSLSLLDVRGNEIASWKQYGQAKIEKPDGLNAVIQKPPNGKGWTLAGFWGYCDSIVITRIGTIWKRTEEDAISLGASGLVDVGFDASGFQSTRRQRSGLARRLRS